MSPALLRFLLPLLAELEPIIAKELADLIHKGLLAVQPPSPPVK